MEIKKALEIVKHHNKWRRGEIEDWNGYTAQELGIAIDVLTKEVESKNRDILEHFITWYNSKPKQQKSENILVSEINKFLKEYEKEKQKGKC